MNVSRNVIPRLEGARGHKLGQAAFGKWVKNRASAGQAFES